MTSENQIRCQTTILQPLAGEMDFPFRAVLCNHRLHSLPAILKPLYEP